MPKHIGIVGCSAEGAALCYRVVCTEAARFLGPHAHPEVTIHTHSLAGYIACLECGDLAGVGRLMQSSAAKLARSGAEFLICPDNTIHQALPWVDLPAALPWLHIADAVAQEALSLGYRRLGLTGTRWLVDSEVYPERLARHGLDWVRPGAEDRNEMNRIIMEELVGGVFRPESVQAFQRIITRLQSDGCDAVVLGCTEIPLIMNATNSPLPVLDSTRLLASAALREACGTPA